MPSTKSRPKLPPEPLHEWSFQAIGTGWWIGLYEPVDSLFLEKLQQAIIERIERFDVTYSRFRADSLVTQISQQAGRFQFPEDASQLFALYRELYDATGGLVTPLVGQLLSDAGYDKDYSLQPGTLTTPPVWDAVMKFRDEVLETTESLLLDFGAVGKGYLVDIVSQIIEAAGITAYCVDGSGDMRVSGVTSPLKIGLENPDAFGEVVGVVDLSHGALCGSAGNRRAWGEFHHIINPAKLKSPRHIKALWVMSDYASTADGLATALFFATPEALRERFNFEYAIVYAGGTVMQSKNFAATMFSEGAS